MENKILIAIHIVTAVMYGITLTSAIEKRKNLQPFVEILIFIFCSISIINLIRELIMMNYDLTWVFPQWYLSRILSCIVIMILINRLTNCKNNKSD